MLDFGKFDDSFFEFKHILYVDYGGYETYLRLSPWRQIQ